MHLAELEKPDLLLMQEATEAVGHPPPRAMIIGDCNMVGPALLPGFRDVGERGPTHDMGEIVPLRLDRCFIRNLNRVRAEILGRAGFDHRPIAVGLTADP